jgi:hypothetical protein
MKMNVFWDVESLITLMMEAASISETSVNFYQTTRGNVPEDIHFHTRRRENLKSQHHLHRRRRRRRLPLFCLLNSSLGA